MKTNCKALLTGLLVVACTACTNPETEASYQVIPLPQEVSLNQAAPFRLNSNSTIYYPTDSVLLKRNAEFLAGYIAQATGFTPQTKALNVGDTPVSHSILLCIDPSIGNPEGYVLSIDENQVTISGQTANGVFYGIQTLRKSIPAQAPDADILLPAGQIKDEPRFAYRGMMLDVGRHFFPVEFIKEYIDLLALHNMNTLHWHLTEDQGWRIEIKKYPKLTEIGSKRSCTVIGHNSGQYDNTPYSGFYTQEEAREIVRYAQERYITVIPEVDMPGHMLAALASYPELGCTGGPYEVATQWGIFDDVLCIGNEKSLQFLKDVMTEIIDIFPSKYIHIGGDEAPRTRWKTCPKCQALIRAKGLKADKEHTAEDRLQSYCMTQIEQFLNSKGRQIIGWDEILEGDVAPNATVMSWRGSAGGIKAAQMGHDVIMTPNDFCYFDYFQTTDTKDEPYDAIGGYVSVEKAYSLEPTAQLNEEQKKHIKGAQANLWTEYISSPEQVEYMVLPRMAALAEVQWTQPEKKDYKDFVKRLVRLMELYKRDGLNYATHVFNVQASFAPDTTGTAKAIIATLGTIDDAPIHYTLDGTTPTASSPVYSAPLSITQSADVRAIAIRPVGNSKVAEKHISFNKATLHPIELNGIQPAPRYSFGGALTLVDGMTGTDNYASGAWLGFIDGDVTVTIDLGQPTSISRVATHALTDMGSWIMGCTGLSVAVSDDNKTFSPLASTDFPAETDLNKKAIEHYETSFEPTETRYVRITIKRSPALPKGHAGEGKAPFLFIDEIEID